MSKKSIGFIIFLIFSFVAMAQFPGEIQKKKDKDNGGENIIAGRNVNMVSGQELYTGDPYLQRQNEPSLAVSTRNPMHLLAGANDYRTVDIPESQGDLPGQQNEIIATGDAWLGVFKSFDGGQSWISSLLPGYPQDNSGIEVGINGSLKNYQVAADPIVRAGANGMFFYCGIAFNRGVEGVSSVFVARYVDNNNKEGGDTIEYLDTTVIDLGEGLDFIDKPWIAVDMPRSDETVDLWNGQEVSQFNVYVVYSVFTGKKSEIRYSKSENSGQSWSDPEPLAEAKGKGYFNIQKKEEEGVFQGATVAFSPKDGSLNVAWRQFNTDSKKSEGAIYFAKTDKKGKKFEKIEEVEKKIEPFDQGSSTASFRTNSYPTMAIDEKGMIYLAWAQREKGKDGQAQIVITSSKDGKKWEKPKEVEKNKDSGHQFMPSLTYAGGKLMLAWYDQREDISGRFTEYIDDISGQTRHTIDVRAAYAKPDKKPDFEDSIQVSRYLFVYDEDSDTYFQAQFNPPNYPLFQGGMWPFHGDYLDVAPSPMFVQDEHGNWDFNTEEAGSSVFHVAWTDNRDVSPPPDGVWINYSPPGADCIGGASPGMRNQNIYTSRISYGIEVGSPGNAKPINGFIKRAFAITVKNTTDELKSFRLVVANQLQASFLEFNELFELDVSIAPFSSISRPVFVNTTVGEEPIRIDVFEIDEPGGSEISGGLNSFIVLNPDNTNPKLEDPGVPGLPDVGDQEIHNPNIANPNIANWTVLNPNIANPNIANPNIANPNIVNPNIANPNIANPNIANPNIANPNIANPNIANPNIANPNIANTSLEGSNITDVEWTVTNGGNTTSSYTFKSFSNQAVPDGLFLQLIIYKVHYTPGTDIFATDSCVLKEVPHHELLANIVNPNIANPNIANPNIANPNIANPNIANASFSVAPGEEVIVNLRLIDPPQSSSQASISARIQEVQDFANSFGGGVTSHSANSGDEIPPAAASKLVIGTSSLPPGFVGATYPNPQPVEYRFLEAFGGTGALHWSIIAGSLPAGLTLDAVSGEIYGEPSTPVTSSFRVQVSDSESQTDTQLYSITVIAPGVPLAITTDSLPDAIEGNPYGTFLEASGGSWPYSWSLAAEALPPGLRIEGEWLTGTAGAEGEYHFDLRVTDDSGDSVIKPFILRILPPGGQAYKISGVVTFSGGESLLPGVLMNGFPEIPTPVTNASGYYEGTVPYGWTGTVSPTIAGYTFNSVSYTNVTYPMITNYEAIASTHTITATTGANGTIDPLGSVVVNHGANKTFTIIPDDGYEIENVVVGEAAIGVVSSYTFENIQANQTISATFSELTYTLTYGAGAGGTISGDSPQSVIHGGSGTQVTAVPIDGFRFVNWSDDDTSNPRTDIGVTDDINVSANFEQITYTLTYTAETGGSISGANPQTVNQGGSGTEVTAVAGSGYTFAGWSDGITSAARTDSNVTADISVTANFEQITHTLTYAAGAGGTINGASPQSVIHGGSGTLVTAIPNSGYRFVDWSDGIQTAARTDTNVTADINVTANFEQMTYAIDASAGSNGSISPLGLVSVNYNSSQTFTVSPDQGYEIEDVLVDGISVGAVSTYAFNNVMATHTISAEFKLLVITYIIDASAGTGGSISLSGTVPVIHGADETFTFAPASNYRVENVIVDGVPQGVLPSYTFYTVTTGHTIHVTFVEDTYTISATAGSGGSISPAGNISVQAGGSETFTITPDNDFEISDVLVDGTPMGAIQTYTFTDVQTNHIIAANFTAVISGLVTDDLNTLTATDLANLLLGQGVEIANAIYTGDNTAAGSFAGGTGSVGFESGIILSSGNIADIVGPNQSDGTTTDFTSLGDGDLNTISSSTTEDAAVLEFDFKPNFTGPVTFRYVFSSEEYNEYVGSFNDVFGFFIDGVNKALLPDGVTQVSINTVNGGNPLGTGAANPEYYRNNSPASLDIEADGLTVVLTLSHNVTLGQWYHIKLAIADASDGAYDSWVFIEAGSFGGSVLDESRAAADSITTMEGTGLFPETDKNIDEKDLFYAVVPDNFINLIKLKESRKQKVDK